MMEIEVSILGHILDDDPETLEIIEQVLKSNNISGFTSHSRADDFLASMDDKIIVGVIDYYLSSGLTGLDVLKALKAKNKSSFVIILSGTKSHKSVIECTNAGCDRFIDKNEPDYLSQLVQFVQDGLVEAKKRWALLDFLQTEMNKNESAS